MLSTSLFIDSRPRNRIGLPDQLEVTSSVRTAPPVRSVGTTVAFDVPSWSRRSFLICTSNLELPAEDSPVSVFSAWDPLTTLHCIVAHPIWFRLEHMPTTATAPAHSLCHVSRVGLPSSIICNAQFRVSGRTGSVHRLHTSLLGKVFCLRSAKTRGMFIPMPKSVKVSEAGIPCVTCAHISASGGSGVSMHSTCGTYCLTSIIRLRFLPE